MRLSSRSGHETWIAANSAAISATGWTPGALELFAVKVLCLEVIPWIEGRSPRGASR